MNDSPKLFYVLKIITKKLYMYGSSHSQSFKKINTIFKDQLIRNFISVNPKVSFNNY